MFLVFVFDWLISPSLWGLRINYRWICKTLPPYQHAVCSPYQTIAKPNRSGDPDLEYWSTFFLYICPTFFFICPASYFIFYCQVKQERGAWFRKLVQHFLYLSNFLDLSNFFIFFHLFLNFKKKKIIMEIKRHLDVLISLLLYTPSFYDLLDFLFSMTAWYPKRKWKQEGGRGKLVLGRILQ